jgi:hypothetical protein
MLVARKVLGGVDLSCEAPYEMYERLMGGAVSKHMILLEPPDMLDAASFAQAIGDIELRLLDSVDYDLKICTLWPELNGFPIDELNAEDTNIQLARCLFLCNCTNPLHEAKSEHFLGLASALERFQNCRRKTYQTTHLKGYEVKLWTSIDESIHRIFYPN